jgi:hypothetical protein
MCGDHSCSATMLAPDQQWTSCPHHSAPLVVGLNARTCKLSQENLPEHVGRCILLAAKHSTNLPFLAALRKPGACANCAGVCCR